MHVGRCQGDVAQRRRPESAHVVVNACEVEEPRVVLGIAARVVDVVQPIVVEADRLDDRADVRAAVGEIEAAVTMKALEPLREEQFHAANGWRRKRLRIAGQETVVGRVEGHDAAHEAGQRADGVQD